MQEMSKKDIRTAFRKSVFERDKHRCVMCGRADNLDAHHIEDRNNLPAGGYVLENGITLCAGDNKDNCHWKAEQYHRTDKAYLGYSPNDLYAKIGSSKELAIQASQELADGRE